MTTYTSCQTRTKTAMKHFTSLTAQARRLLFPLAPRPERDPLPESWWKKVILFLMRSPSLEYGDDASWIYFSAVVWCVILQIWITFGLNTLHVHIPGLISVTTQPASGSTTTITSLWLAIPIVVIVLLIALIAMIAIPCTYAGVWDFWRIRRKEERIWYTLFFLIVPVLITIFWLCPAISQQQVRQHLWRVLGVYFGFLLPSIIVLCRFLVALLGGGLKFLVRSLLSIILVHKPFPQKVLNTLVLDPIPTPDKTAWLLENLETAEIRLLREWAQANRDATEKRLLPTTIFLFGLFGILIGLLDVFIGVLDLFSGTEVFDNAVQTALVWILQTQFTDNWTLNLLVNLLVIFVFVWLYILFNLLVNLIAQSVIIETCIVAEYAYAKTTQAKAPAIDQSGFWLNLWWCR